uniref:Uncharacterized protein n=1 Tax=Ditylenchus dipsaci TaxID=166011 RepID=A0A915E042_9BILA
MNNQVASSVESTPTRRKSRTLISTVSQQMPLISGEQVSHNYPIQQLHRQSVASRLSPMVVAAHTSPAIPTAFMTSSTFISANCIEATQRLVQQIKPGSIVLPQAIVPLWLLADQISQKKK